MVNLSGLAFRAALQGDGRLTEHLQNDGGWIRLVTAVYGGYYDYQRPPFFASTRNWPRFLARPTASGKGGLLATEPDSPGVSARKIPSIA